MQEAKKDFFISYTKVDRDWAEWIAWQLEGAGYSAIIQAWDFPAGSDFVEEMDRAIVSAERTIAVLSPDYLESRFTYAEWRAAYKKDPKGEKGLLVPVRVRECEPDGVLSTIAYIDLVNLEEDVASKELLNSINRLLRGRGKPELEPTFPDLPTRTIFKKPDFPPTVRGVPPVLSAFLVGPTGKITLRKSTVTIGRRPTNQVVLDSDTQVSGAHAEISPTADGYAVVDLKSTNKTFVNEQPLSPNTPHTLHPGDVIRIGTSKFIYELADVHQVEKTTLAPEPPKYAPPPPPVDVKRPVGPMAFQQTVQAPPSFSQSQTRKSSNRTLWIILASVGGGLVLLCAIISIISYSIGLATTNAQQQVLQTYCTNVEQSNFQQAYSQLSSSAQQKDPFGTYQSNWANLHVTSCSVVSTNTIQYTLATGFVGTIIYALAQDSSGSWKIDNCTTNSFSACQ